MMTKSILSHGRNIDVLRQRQRFNLGLQDVTGGRHKRLEVCTKATLVGFAWIIWTMRRYDIPHPACNHSGKRKQMVLGKPLNRSVRSDRPCKRCRSKST